MRRIDLKHHIDDEGRIVKTHNNTIVPEDEPLFLLRGRDHLSLALVKIYKELCELDHCTRFQLDSMDMVVDRFMQFRIMHPERMKQPGVTKGL